MTLGETFHFGNMLSWLDRLQSARSRYCAATGGARRYLKCRVERHSTLRRLSPPFNVELKHYGNLFNISSNVMSHLTFVTAGGLRTCLLLAGLLSGLQGCGAVLVVPFVATTQELIRDRKGEFERARNAVIGRNLYEACDSPRLPGQLDFCGKHVATRNLQSGKEYVFETVPRNCSYSLHVDSDQQIIGWSYVSEPAECWKFYLPPP